jgi:crotonobetainyl-CoA:carnitine CoA-transferase CaiB-like acyl-CoA transferase
MGSAHPLNAPYQAFRTADGWLNLGAANQANWLRMLEVLEEPELAADERFADNASRLKNRLALAGELEKIFARRTTADWLARLEAVGVPAGPVLNVSEMHEDPQAIAREMVVEVDHPTAGPVRSIGLPVKFSATPGVLDRPAPLLGQHSREVLSEVGLTAKEIDDLVAAGVVICAE